MRNETRLFIIAASRDVIFLWRNFSFHQHSINGIPSIERLLSLSSPQPWWPIARGNIRFRKAINARNQPTVLAMANGCFQERILRLRR